MVMYRYKYMRMHVYHVYAGIMRIYTGVYIYIYIHMHKHLRVYIVDRISYITYIYIYIKTQLTSSHPAPLLFLLAAAVTRAEV